MKLKKLHQFKHTDSFSVSYMFAFEVITINWQQVILKKLEKQQEHWNSNKHLVSFIRVHSQCSTTVNFNMTFISAWLLHLCSCLSYLVVFSHTHNQKYTNNAIKTTCMNIKTDQMKNDCVLNHDYAILKSTSFKLRVIVCILKNHEDINVLIMFSFTEITLMIKRVSLSSLQDFQWTSAWACIILYHKHVLFFFKCYACCWLFSFVVHSRK